MQEQVNFIPIFGGITVSLIILLFVYRRNRNSFYLFQIFIVLFVLNLVNVYTAIIEILGFGGGGSPLVTSLGGTSLVFFVALIGYIFARRPISIIKEITEVSEEISKGNLTSKSIKQIRSFKEFQTLVDTFNETVTTLTNTMVEINSTSDIVNESALSMVSSAEQVNASSEEITSIAQQITVGTQSQAEKLLIASKESLNLKNIFNLEITNITNAAGNIKGLSNQVNMLALNASIEAARAGEYGRGFAVVAENIRMLAEDTNSSVEDVNNVISNLQTSLSGAIEKIISSIDSVSALAEETVSGAEESSAATEEQSASMEEITAFAQEQLESVKTLRRSISKFKYNN